jgi:predicted enzyme related to lactoylglutathione lyase
MLMHDVINWFEIPVTDIARAVKFYEAIFGIKLQVSRGEGFSSANFPHNGGVGGGLVQGDGYAPNAGGTLIYLNANPDLSAVLERVERAGGQRVKPKTDIGENGFFAIILDSEGNRIALHSMN